MSYVIFISFLLVIATWLDWDSTQEVLEEGGREKNKVALWIANKIGWKYKLIFDLVVGVGFTWLAAGMSWRAGMIVGGSLAILQFVLAFRNYNLAEELRERR